MGHFHWIDIGVLPGPNNDTIFDKIYLKFPTKFIQYETGNSSLSAPSRPSATKKGVIESLFAKEKLTYEDYDLLSLDVQIKKEKRELLLYLHHQRNRLILLDAPYQTHTRDFLLEIMRFSVE